MLPARVVRHTAAFNDAVRSGDWSSFVREFTEDAAMRFVGVPAGPFVGRDAIAGAYSWQPPTDTLSVTAVESDGLCDTVRFRWSQGGAGVMRLTWRGDLVADLDTTFAQL